MYSKSRLPDLEERECVFPCDDKNYLTPNSNWQVETVGTVYMLVSGAPERRRAHAASAASAALAIARAIPALTVGEETGHIKCRLFCNCRP